MKSNLQLTKDAEKLKSAISSQISSKSDQPALVILVGLPGSGKSYFAAKLRQNIPSVVLESDFLRKILIRVPKYSEWEHLRLFRAIHSITKDLLLERYNVILDATNLSENYRKALIGIAKDSGAQYYIVHMDTSREIAKERLKLRKTDGGGYSDADWRVYEQLEKTFEPINGGHFSIRNSLEIESTIEKIMLSISKKR